LSITADLIRGNTDTIILSCLENGDSYGYRINKSILQTTGGRFELKEATLYTSFKRLEEAGAIVSYWGEEDGGARRRYYQITELGRKQLQQARTDWQDAKEMIDTLTLPKGEQKGV